MTRSLHPSTLFHFTEKPEVFFKILSDMQFKPFLAREMIHGKGIGGRRNFAVPMVSFCDIRLTQLDEHTTKYGSFGFGLTKDWAEKNNLHPVLYMSRESDLFSVYNQRVRVIKDKLVPLWRKRHSLQKNEFKIFESLKKEYADLYNLLRYMKNYKGRLIREGEKTNDNFIFADEKEWRYVPEPFVGDMWPSLNLQRVQSKSEKAELSEKFSNFGISFSMSDIKYFLVPDEYYVSKLQVSLSNIGANNLHAKILTMNQVMDDF